jgi:hypothetical protein
MNDNLFTTILSSSKVEEVSSLSELASLSELDFLTDLFSFFTKLDSSVSRQTCKWWNDLLSKDGLITKYIENNIFSFNIINDDDILYSISGLGGEAASLSYLEILKWCRESKRFPRICSIAAAHKKLRILKWTKSEGYCWNSDTCFQAAKFGHLTILKWLIKYGCNFDFRAYIASIAQTGHLDICSRRSRS